MPVFLLFLAVLSAAINLRAGMASVGAVLDQVIAHYGAPASLAGVVTAMPGTFFCIMGLVAVPLARRTGLTPTVLGGAALTFAGLALRPFMPNIGLFIACTAGVVAGVAVANVLLPVWVKQHGGRHMVALMTVYSGVLGLSAALGPLSDLVTDSWQGALGVWAIPSGIQAVVWLTVLWFTRADFPRAEGHQAEITGSLWRSKTAVTLMLFFGLQSMNGYAQMGWLPVILKDAGVPDSTAATALAVVGFTGVLGGLTLPTVISRVRSLTPWVLTFGLLTAAGYFGLLVAPAAAPLAWAVVLGLGGWCFPLAIALIPARTRSPLVTAKLSGFVQPYGYVVAAVGPMLIGMAYGALGSFQPILVALVILGLALGLLGITAARNVYIDDELAAQGRV